MDGDYIGRSLRRLEDFRFLTGRGRYVEDIACRASCMRSSLRSPHAHALIERHRHRGRARDAGGARRLHRRRSRRRRDRAAALHRAGRDRRADDRAAAPGAGARPGAPCRRSGGVRRRRHREQARDAAERIAVDVPAAAGGRRCARRRSPPARRCCGTRRRAICPTASSAATGRRSRRRSPAAAHVVEIELVNNRLVVAPIEPRAAIGSYDAAAGSLRPAADRPGRAQHPQPARRVRCFTCRPSASACARPMSAAASA